MLAARTLAANGASVVVLEAKNPGFGASSRNHGMLSGGLKIPANLERRLAKIGKTSPEALAAVVKALTNIAAKVPEPAQAVARKFQA